MVGYGIQGRDGHEHCWHCAGYLEVSFTESYSGLQELVSVRGLCPEVLTIHIVSMALSK